MRLVSLSAHQYRSLRAIRMELGGVSLFIGANGVGKSNLYCNWCRQRCGAPLPMRLPLKGA